jgi:hypothetical protein
MAKIKKIVVEYYSFYCPGCKHQHSYPVNSDGTGWTFNGNMELPSFTPSLLNQLKVQNEKTGEYDIVKSRCHLYVTNGKIQYCNDCTHEFAGQTIDIPEI